MSQTESDGGLSVLANPPDLPRRLLFSLHTFFFTLPIFVVSRLASMGEDRRNKWVNKRGVRGDGERREGGNEWGACNELGWISVRGGIFAEIDLIAVQDHPFETDQKVQTNCIKVVNTPGFSSSGLNKADVNLSWLSFTQPVQGSNVALLFSFAILHKIYKHSGSRSSVSCCCYKTSFPPHLESLFSLCNVTCVMESVDHCGALWDCGLWYLQSWA